MSLPLRLRLSLKISNSKYVLIIISFTNIFLELGRFHRLGDDDILVLPLDMTDFTSHNSAVRKVIREFGRIDYLVHNAGRSQRAR